MVTRIMFEGVDDWSGFCLQEWSGFIRGKEVMLGLISGVG